MTFIPFFWNERQGEQRSTQLKQLTFSELLEAETTSASLNSSLFYWWFIALSDCRHLNSREIENFPLGLFNMTTDNKQSLARINKLLMKDYQKNSIRKEAQYNATGKVIYDEFYPKHSKPIIDEIDRVLAKHYGFTEEELDFLINYDFKYRMGRNNDEESEV
ncbi:MAG: hypothetical protein PVS3B3_11900 [Ktedonobacteraceae bacterium]